MKKTQELAPLSEEQLAILNGNYPVNEDSGRMILPKFGLLSKDIIEETGTGKNKQIKVIESAGTFYTEKDMGETNEEGKKVWTRTYLPGEVVDGIIVYHRYKLKKFDKGLDKFYSTPVYDNAEQVLPLCLDKQVIKRGTEKELRSLYPKLTAKGKPSSSLEKKTVLYFMYEGELHQLEISVSAGYEFSSYKRKCNPSTVLTILSSTEETFGTNTYRKMQFNIARPLSSGEFDLIAENQDIVKSTVESDAKFMLASGNEAVISNMSEEDIKDF